MKRRLVVNGIVASSVAVRIAAASPVGAPSVDRARRAEIARGVSAARPGAALTKAELRAPMHALVAMLGACYRQAQARAPDPDIDGVVNLELAVDSEPGQGAIVAVRGFDTTGELGRSREFRDCVRSTAEQIVLPPIAAGGHAEISYPVTFAPRPPDNRGAAFVARANQAVADGRWAQALAAAEAGLALTSLDGPRRRALILAGGLAACHLKHAPAARHYYALASATFEPRIRDACARAAQIDLTL